MNFNTAFENPKEEIIDDRLREIHHLKPSFDYI